MLATVANYYSMLRGSTVGYPSDCDNLASCSFIILYIVCTVLPAMVNKLHHKPRSLTQIIPA